VHGWTGLRAPALDFSRLGPNVEALQLLIEIHYQFYLFYANMIVACAVAYAGYRLWLGRIAQVGWPDLLFVASRRCSGRLRAIPCAGTTCARDSLLGGPGALTTDGAGHVPKRRRGRRG